MTLDALNQYASPPLPSQQPITILIRFKTMETLETQLNSISNQLNFSSSYKIHIICTTETEKLNLASKSFPHTLSVNPTKTWYDHIHITDNTNNIIILDNQVIPGNRYFNFVLRLLNTPLFHHTLLGSESSFICQPYAYQVPTLQDVFLLSRSQFELVKSTPTDQISQLLFDLHGIPSILLPSDSDSFSGNTQSKCDLLSKESLLFYKTSSNLDEMICKFAKTIQTITVISPNDGSNNLLDLPCEIKVHQVMKQELDLLLNEIVPRVIICENKQDITHTNATTINFPTLDIPFVTPWITDLSLDTLQRNYIQNKTYTYKS